MTIDVPVEKSIKIINTNDITFNEKEPKLIAEYQGKPISFDKDRTFVELTLDGSYINPEVWASITSTKPLMTIPPQDDNSSVNIQELIKELKELKTRVNRTVALVHNCQRCGATLEVDEHKSIFCCKYCGATYLLGSVQPNSVYN